MNSSHTTVIKCPTCGKLTPHTTEGAQAEENGKHYQLMKCTICETSQRVYTGDFGEEFQENVDWPPAEDAPEGDATE